MLLTGREGVGGRLNRRRVWPSGRRRRRCRFLARRSNRCARRRRGRRRSRGHCRRRRELDRRGWGRLRRCLLDDRRGRWRHRGGRRDGNRGDRFRFNDGFFRCGRLDRHDGFDPRGAGPWRRGLLLRFSRRGGWLGDRGRGAVAGDGRGLFDRRGRGESLGGLFHGGVDAQDQRRALVDGHPAGHQPHAEVVFTHRRHDRRGQGEPELTVAGRRRVALVSRADPRHPIRPQPVHFQIERGHVRAVVVKVELGLGLPARRSRQHRPRRRVHGVRQPLRISCFRSNQCVLPKTASCRRCCR